MLEGRHGWIAAGSKHGQATLGSMGPKGQNSPEGGAWLGNY